MEYLQVDVFAEAPYRGNPLAVFPDAQDLTATQMQAIAREMNLSETTFVIAADAGGYEVRIFTPVEQLPFAGHPTLGTAWALRHLGRVTDPALTQRSKAGETPVTFDDDLVWFERTGRVAPDLFASDRAAHDRIGAALGLDGHDIGLEAREFGRSGRLQPAHSDAGLYQLMVPVRDLDALGRARPDAARLRELSDHGLYCFTAEAAGRLRARGFFAPVGVEEDPATGSAAAALGLYLADRMGSINIEVHQGIEMGRPSVLHVDAEPGRVKVGGRCRLVLTGKLEELPA